MVAEAAGQARSAGGYAAASGIGPPVQTARDGPKTPTAASSTASPANALDSARTTSAQALQGIQQLAAERAQLYANLKQLDLDLVKRGPSGGPERQALQKARQRMLDELTQMDDQLQAQQVQLRAATDQLKRATSDVDADTAYRAYRP